ncbi:uncharacterized protein LOC141902297 [Tubulanus polymorphus]|uniref:uncharacterized protein LOC141902297 n=1 Tax=Tubulanus polymorphus TaxID=672921 RepID=UPI003DA65FDF
MIRYDIPTNMRRVSFKGLRLSFKSRDGQKKSSVSDEENERVQPTSFDKVDSAAGQLMHVDCSHERNLLVAQSESNYVTNSEIQLPQRKEKQSILKTIRSRITASFHKKHTNQDESVNFRTNRSKKKGKKKYKPKRFPRCSLGIQHLEKPSNTSDELCSEISVHASSNSKNSLNIASDKRETHSSCSSDSCEHEATDARCSNVSVNIHSGDKRLASAKNLTNTSPSVSALRKVDYSSPAGVVLCSSSLHSGTSLIKNSETMASCPSDAEPSQSDTHAPSRPDMLMVNNIFSPQTLNSFSLFNLMAFRTDNILMMERYDASLQSPVYDEVRDVPKIWSLTKELLKLSRFGWYWGPLTRVEAEEKLSLQPNGAFLVRDSSDDRYLLSLSFRSNERTLHTRIEHCNGMFSFYAQPELEGYTSIVDLIEHSMNDSLSGVFCYSRARTPGEPSFPVRLTKPVSRFTQVRSLQYLCRFVIRQFTRLDHIQKLPLPNQIKGWLEENQY